MDSKSQSDISLESIYSALAQISEKMGEKIDAIQKQVAILSANAGLDTSIAPALIDENVARQKHVDTHAVPAPSDEYVKQQKKILEGSSAEDVYIFARDVPGADLPALRKRLVDMDSSGLGRGYLAIFNKDIDIQSRLKEQMNAAPALTLGAEAEKWQQDIINSGTGWDAYIFARDIDGADIRALQKVVSERGDGRTAYKFACQIYGADIEALQQVIIDRCDAIHAYDFAKHIANADIEALQQVVLDSGNSMYACNFARNIPGADIQALQKVVLERGDGRTAYWFASNVDGADLIALQDRLIKLYRTGSDIDSSSNSINPTHYFYEFKNNPDIQDKLKEQLVSAGQSEPDGTAGRKRHRPS